MQTSRQSIYSLGKYNSGPQHAYVHFPHITPFMKSHAEQPDDSLTHTDHPSTTYSLLQD